MPFIGLFQRTIIIVVFSFSLISDANTQEKTYILNGATIINGISDTPLYGYSLLIEAGVIKDVIKPGEPVPKNLEVLDFSDKYILPGFIDSHVHWLGWMGELFINHGITSVFALSNINNDRRKDSHVNNSLPRLFHSGNRPPFKNGDSKENIQSAVQEWLRREPDIAHFPTYNDEASRAYKIAADEVHKAGYLIFGHTENAVNSINAGHDVIEHIWGFAQAAMSSQELEEFQEGDYLTWATFMSDDWDKLDMMIKEAVKKNIYLNPTLVYEWGGMSNNADNMELDVYRILKNPRLVYFPDNIAESLLLKNQQIKNFSRHYGNMPFISLLPEADREEFQRGYNNIREFMYRYINAGGKIHAGTDTISGGMPGLSVHQEMQMLVEAGLTPMQAIKSATRWPAEFLEGVSGKLGPAIVGSLEKGKRADLIILDANPLENIKNTQIINRVMKNGEWVVRDYHPDSYTFKKPSRSIAGSTFAPVLNSIKPAIVKAGQPSLRAIVTGSGFQLISLAFVDGVAVETHFINPRQIELEIPGDLLKSAKPNPYSAPGPYQNIGVIGDIAIEVYIYNPPPEGGESNRINIMVSP